MRITATARESTPRLDRLVRRSANPGPALRKAAGVLREGNAAYITGRARYRPLSDAHAAVKQRTRGTDRPLVGGELERSLTDPRHRYAVEKITIDRVTVGTKNPVARLHKRGTSTGLPKRAPVRMTPRVKRDAIATVRAELLG